MKISIHALLAESDHYDNYNLHCVEISIHALLAESDSAPRITPTASRNFYPRSPCGERPTHARIAYTAPHFYPRSPCGERRWLHCWKLAARDISIHALLAESDTVQIVIIVVYALFLSTLSLRRATVRPIEVPQYQLLISIHALLAESDTYIRDIALLSIHFYPRSPCGERHLRVVDGSESSIISIHALLAESDRL